MLKTISQDALRSPNQPLSKRSCLNHNLFSTDINRINITMNKVALFCLGLGLTSKKDYSAVDRLLGFLTLVPLIFVFLTPINAASAVVLSIGGYPPWDKAIIGLVTVAFAGWGINTLNHYIDRERDKIIWPQRAIPSGRVKASTALASAVVALICALLLSCFFFNPTNFLILLVAIILGAFYSAFLRDRIGYLSLPPIIGLISLGGWSAFSPETLFTSWLPWLLYLIHLVWQAGHIMVYYPLHIIPQVTDKQKMKMPTAFFFKPSAKTAVRIGIGFICLTFMMSIILHIFASLSHLYLVIVLVTGIYGLSAGFIFLRDTSNTKKGLRAFTALSTFRLATVAAILLDIFISHI
jgi:4-hydroxybenzoate polyprenyltransferase